MTAETTETAAVEFEKGVLDVKLSFIAFIYDGNNYGAYIIMNVDRLEFNAVIHEMEIQGIWVNAVIQLDSKQLDEITQPDKYSKSFLVAPADSGDSGWKYLHQVPIWANPA